MKTRLLVITNGKERTLTLKNVHRAPHLARNIISYRKLKQNGFGLVYNGSSLARFLCGDGAISFDVSMHINVLYVQTSVTEVCQEKPSDVIGPVWVADAVSR